MKRMYDSNKQFYRFLSHIPYEMEDEDVGYPENLDQFVSYLFEHHMTGYESEVLKFRFGMTEGYPGWHTLEDVGKRYDISRMRVQIIQDRTIRRIQIHLNEIVEEFNRHEMV